MILQIFWLGGTCAAPQPPRAASCSQSPSLLLPALLAHLRSATMSPCLFSTLDRAQWSQVGHLPWGSAGSPHGGRCCSWVSVPQKGHSAAGGPYRGRALKEYFQCHTGCFSFSLDVQHLFFCPVLFKKKLFHPHHNHKCCLFCFVFLYSR